MDKNEYKGWKVIRTDEFFPGCGVLAIKDNVVMARGFNPSTNDTQFHTAHKGVIDMIDALDTSIVQTPVPAEEPEVEEEAEGFIDHPDIDLDDLEDLLEVEVELEDDTDEGGKEDGIE